MVRKNNGSAKHKNNPRLTKGKRHKTHLLFIFNQHHQLHLLHLNLLKRIHVTEMAAAAKMDELLVSWLSSDNVYENVLSLIETYRAKGNGIVKSPPSSPQFQKNKDIKKEHKEQSKSRDVPPFYRSPGMHLPPIRRNSMDSDQSWDGSYHKMLINSNETKSSKISPSSLEYDGSNFIPIKEQVKKIYAEFSVPENMESSSSASQNVLTIDNFVKITKDICRFPTFFNRPLYRRILYLWNVRNIKNEKQKMIIWNEFEKPETISILGVVEPKSSSGGTTGTSTKDINELLQHLDKNISLDIFQWFWVEEMQDYDMEERFFRLLKKPHEDFVGKDCFMPFMQELLNDHPVSIILFVAAILSTSKKLDATHYTSYNSHPLGS
jgi:hypothetical protein